MWRGRGGGGFTNFGLAFWRICNKWRTCIITWRRAHISTWMITAASANYLTFPLRLVQFNIAHGRSDVPEYCDVGLLFNAILPNTIQCPNHSVSAMIAFSFFVWHRYEETSRVLSRIYSYSHILEIEFTWKWHGFYFVCKESGQCMKQPHRSCQAVAEVKYVTMS